MYRSLKLLLVCILFAATICTVNRAFAQLPYVTSNDAKPAPRPDSSVTTVSIVGMPRTDTIYVFIKDKLTNKIAVHEHYEIKDNIELPCRRMFDIGSWSDLVTERVGATSYSYGTGIWTSFRSIPAGNIRLVLHVRNGTTKEVTPLQKQPKAPKQNASPAQPAPSDTTTHTSFNQAQVDHPHAARGWFTLHNYRR
ncbi:MAG: hypothetical protein V1907_02630 [Candidatus Kerfeldbacteria bacterium]